MPMWLPMNLDLGTTLALARAYLCTSSRLYTIVACSADRGPNSPGFTSLGSQAQSKSFSAPSISLSRTGWDDLKAFAHCHLNRQFSYECQRVFSG
eukprot:6472895-Amphidinium_carterae.1